MNFYDTVTEMGYKVTNMSDVIDICKEDVYAEEEPIGEIHIVFYTKEKKILGYVKPLRNFYTLDDVTHFYNTLFLMMQKEVKILAEKSKYVII